MAVSEVDAAEQLFLDKWYGIDAGDAQRIIEATRHLADDKLLQRPVLVTAAIVSLQRLSAEQPADHAGALHRFAALVLAFPESSIGASLTGVRLRQWRLMEMIARRWRREYDAALELSSLLAENSGSLSLSGMLFRPDGDGLWPGHVSLQRGITEALAGNFSASMRLFTKAYGQGGEPPYLHYAKANAAANAAMITTLEGNTGSALDWINRCNSVAEVPDWISHLTYVGRDIAQTQLALDRMDTDAAASILTAAHRDSSQVELWPFLLHVSINHSLASGEPVKGYEMLKEAGFARGRVTAIDTVAGHVVFRAYLDVLIAMGEAGIALRLANELGHPLRSLVPVARTHLFGENSTEAARVASHALRRAELPLRDMWEATWVHALAEAALGHFEEAKRSYEIIRKGSPAMMPSLLARAPRDTVERLYDLLGERRPEVYGSMQHVVPELPKLTSRERQILQLLAEGHLPREIAEKEVTSIHTVRTHIKGIYRKLGVSARDDAIRRAEALGLLRWVHLDGKNHVFRTSA
ncbi:helix-turn-helix transcriptional regulator [Leucobacter chromiireducens]|uniref:helix-turn-helix transcriptional regulator n=1 Tax=Leucobacter chromiireducens TaxID=283877 RepID=UPI0013DE59E1|nr:LuxR C-terminal-related transcriptional regulator [Leucobacter chromiireducens]